jgi:hypothetical protein
MPVTLLNTSITGISEGGIPGGVITANNLKSQDFIYFQPLSTPIAREWSFGGSVATTVSISGLPANTRYILADVFINCVSEDHFNVVLGAAYTPVRKNWIDVRGQQPSTQFGTADRDAVRMSYHGDADGYSPFYGVWFSSQIIKMIDSSTLGFNNYGNNGTSGWVYMRIKQYSL